MAPRKADAHRGQPADVAAAASIVINAIFTSFSESSYRLHEKSPARVRHGRAATKHRPSPRTVVSVAALSLSLPEKAKPFNSSRCGPNTIRDG